MNWAQLLSRSAHEPKPPNPFGIWPWEKLTEAEASVLATWTPRDIMDRLWQIAIALDNAHVRSRGILPRLTAIVVSPDLVRVLHIQPWGPDGALGSLFEHLQYLGIKVCAGLDGLDGAQPLMLNPPLSALTVGVLDQGRVTHLFDLLLVKP